jgi:peptidoglycan hydrolase-like protein with peptidoglycan-binding domain
MVDTQLMAAQGWLNRTYATNPGVPTIPTDGIPGWQTMIALTRALQVELGITALSDNFGATTLSMLSTKVGNVSSATATTRPNIVGILQCAMWGKGYWGGTEFGVFSSQLGESVSIVRGRVGMDLDTSVPPKLFKSLLTMDAYVVVAGGTAKIRTIQQWMNSRYLARRDYYLIPCDGLFSRTVQNGLMLALQYELGMVDGTANGNFGPTTRSELQAKGNLTVGSSDGTNKLVSLFQAALVFNGFDTAFDGNFSQGTRSSATAFQSFAELPASGAANYGTWASLLVSTGDPDRAGTASDAMTPVTAAKAASLYSNGYRTIGRYLSVAAKRIQAGEIATIHSAGLTVFPIFQEYNNAPQYFSQSKGFAQGVSAVRRARQLGFKAGAIIYFTVDYDATGDEIDAFVIDHFLGIRDGVATSTGVTYRVGIYGTRHVCAKVTAAGLASSSFVSGMSTGWSGNLGFPLPQNWAYDQIKTLTVGTGSGAIEIDKDIKSVRAEPVSSSGVVPTPVITSGSAKSFDEEFFWWFVHLRHLNEQSFPGLSNKQRDTITLWYIQSKNPDYVAVQFALYLPLSWAPTSAEYDAYSSFPGIAAGKESEPGLEFRSNYGVPGGVPGDTPHLAVVMRGYWHYGRPTDTGTVAIGDLGGWALDLVSSWSEYSSQFKTPGGDATTQYQRAKAWAKANIGKRALEPGAGWFSFGDLIADIDGYILGSRQAEQPARPLDDIVREVRIQISNDPKWRFQAFFSERFGGNVAKASATVRDLFGSGAISTSGPVSFTMFGKSLQTVYHWIDGGGGPNASEIQAFAEAWAELLLALSLNGPGAAPGV